jgi:hypothetical protein
MPENQNASLDALNMNLPDVREALERQQVAQAGVEMPRYRCHKEVHALKIGSIEHMGEDTTTEENPIVFLHFAEKGYGPIRMNLRGKPTPEAGWYYVVYEDGYKSFSPAKAFEDGYTRI